MQANTTTPHPRVSDLAAWIVTILGVAFLVLLLLSFALETRTPASTTSTSTSLSGSVAYFEFGATADTLWLAQTADSASREAIITVPHAQAFGVIPSISPDGTAVIYAALPPSTAAPGPDSPAELWYAPLNAGAEPRLMASAIDLLVAPVWTPDAGRVVYRRSNADGYSLVDMSVRGGVERVIVTAPADEALFPVGFSPDGATLYHVALSDEGSRLFAVDAITGSLTPVAVLSDGLTRDWAISPDGSRLAFLALHSTPEALNSRAYVVDLATGEASPVTGADASAFGPVWNSEGALIVGALTPGGEGSLIRIQNGETSQVLGPAAGFDVPLAYLPGGAYLVRAFEGASASAPGRSALTLIDPDGERNVLSTSDVTFVGWSAR